MTGIEQILDNWVKDMQDELIDQYHNLGLKASGAFERGLKNETSQNKTRIIDTVGNSWYMVNGRNKNKSQDKDSVKKWVGWAGSTFLKKWVQDKGLDISPFAVAYSIAKKGFKGPANGKLMDVFTQNKFDELTKELGNYQIETIKSEVVKPFMNAYNASGKFDVVDTFKFYTPLPRFDANEVSIMLQFDCKQNMC